MPPAPSAWSWWATAPITVANAGGTSQSQRTRRHWAGRWRLTQQPHGTGDDRTFACRLRHPADIAALLEPSDCVSRRCRGCGWTCLHQFDWQPCGLHQPFAVGWVKDLTQSTDNGMYLIASLILLGGFMV